MRGTLLRHSRSSIQSARDAHVSTPSESYSAAAAQCLRPSSPSGQERIVCGSPDPDRAAEPRGQAREHHRRAARRSSRPARSWGSRAPPRRLGPHAAVVIAVEASGVQQAPNRPSRPAARRERCRARPSRGGPADDAGGEGVARRPSARGPPLGRRDLVRRRRRPARRAAARSGAPSATSVSPSRSSTRSPSRRPRERRVERRRAAQRDLHHLGAHQLGHPPAGVAAVRRVAAR